ncbi:MAG TPA: FAD-dependent monooxygenase [Pseudonocardiaceae bacterium]
MSIEFENGEQFEADIVVGADGVHSTVRSWVTGEQPPVYTRTSGFRGLVPVAALPSLPDPLAVQFWMGPDAHLLHYAISGGQLVNFLAVSEGPAVWPSRDNTLAARDGELAAHFAGWHPAVREMIDAVPQSVRWALVHQPPLRHWSRGRAVLIGDAAHTMLPHQGQGANQAIEDAFVLARCLATSPGTAFERYQRLRRTRTRLIQASSLATSALLHLPDGPDALARDANLAEFPNRFGWIHDHDVAAAALS